MDKELNLVTSDQQFSNEDKAREFLEKLRWPDGTVCPHCGELGTHSDSEAKTEGKTEGCADAGASQKDY